MIDRWAPRADAALLAAVRTTAGSADGGGRITVRRERAGGVDSDPSSRRTSAGVRESCALKAFTNLQFVALSADALAAGDINFANMTACMPGEWSPLRRCEAFVYSR